MRESTGLGQHNIRPVQELLGHKEVMMAIIYSHVLKCGPAGVVT